MKTMDMAAGGCAMRLHLSAARESLPLVFINGGREDGDEVAALLEDLPLNIAIVDPGKWTDALSPWRSPALNEKMEDFGGKGSELISDYRNSIIPAAEQLVGIKPPFRVIAGYSLAGLWGIYAAWESGLFERVAAVSASLWYEGFLDYLRAKTPAVSLRRVRLSLGDREEKARNPRLAKIGTATREARKIMDEKGIAATLVMTAGGHFTNAAGRMADAIRAAMIQ